jgi:hypothetical protein
MVLKYFFEDGFSNLPLINKSYRSAILATLLLSGAGARFLELSNLSLIVFFFVGMVCIEGSILG